MRLPRVYVDTSVIGGYFDPEFARWSRALVDDFRAERLQPFLSDLLAAELESAPARVRHLFAELREAVGPLLELSPLRSTWRPGTARIRLSRIASASTCCASPSRRWRMRTPWSAGTFATSYGSTRFGNSTR